jgi:hypothetical protein
MRRHHPLLRLGHLGKPRGSHSTGHVGLLGVDRGWRVVTASASSGGRAGSQRHGMKIASAERALPRDVSWREAHPFRRVLRTNGTRSLKVDFVHTASRNRNFSRLVAHCYEIRLKRDGMRGWDHDD